MDIKALPSGTSCLADANIFIYHLADLSSECSDLWRGSHAFEILAFVTTTIVAEVLHRRLIAEALAKNLISPGQPLKKLKANPSAIQGLSDYVAEIEELLRLPFRIIEATKADIDASHHLRHTHGFFVNDSINLACASRNGLIDIVSHDADFTRVGWHKIVGTNRHLSGHR